MSELPDVTVKPTLKLFAGTPPVRTVALVLHGGRTKGMSRVPSWSLAYLRMRPFATVIRRLGGPDGPAVALLRHTVRGWNGDLRSPVADARWALDEVRRRFGPVDVALVGHSMGGRTALAVADDPSVRTVVALAPWIEAGDRVEPVTGRNVLIVHGTSDHMTDPGRSAQFARAAQGRAERVSYVAVRGERHPLLRRARFIHELTAAYTIQSLTGRAPAKPLSSTVTDVLAKAFAGTATISV